MEFKKTHRYATIISHLLWQNSTNKTYKLSKSHYKFNKYTMEPFYNTDFFWINIDTSSQVIIYIFLARDE